MLTLPTMQSFYGPQHTIVVICLENMAELYRRMGRDTEADELTLQAPGFRAGKDQPPLLLIL